MTFISESIIDKILTQLETDQSKMDKFLDQLTDQQEYIVAYLLDEDGETVLSEDEQDYLIFLAIVIWRSFIEAGAKLPEINMEQLNETEDKNWGLINESSSALFYERVSPFFEGYPQEDLLAFVEDSVNADDDDDNTISSIGKEPVFIKLKTLIDVLMENAAY